MRAKDFDGIENMQKIDKATGTGISVLAEKGRVWLLGINHPEKYGLCSAKIAEILQDACNEGKITFFCCIKEQSIETDENGNHTPHIHIVIYFPGEQRGSWLHKRFPHASLFACRADTESVVQYIKKNTNGSWYGKAPEKLAEKLPKSEADYLEWGEIPNQKCKRLAKADELVRAIAAGATDSDLLAMDASIYNKFAHIRQTRMVLKSEEFLHKFRTMDVTYIEGATGTGKTRYVMQQTNYEVFTVDDYDHIWDGYEQQEAVFFDEFRSQPDFSDLLRWLDGNPVKLKARYSNAVACFTKIYIASNWTLEQQYLSVQREHPTDWQAFLRRINHRRIYTGLNTYTDYDKINGVWLEKGA